MEVKAQLDKPYTEEQRINFIVENNHQKGYEIRETETALEAWGLTAEEEQEQQEEAERKRVASLNLTKADFWIALLDGGITKAMVKEKIELIPDEMLKAKTLIRLDEADHFWRGDAAMDIIGDMFGLTPEDLTYLFEHKALPPAPEPEPEEDEVEEVVEDAPEEPIESEDE